MKILYVDNDVDMLDTVKRLLAEKGHQVTTADSLQAFEQAMEQGEFDGFICDGTVHTRYDGLVLAERLNQQKISVVVFTSHPPKNLIVTAVDKFAGWESIPNQLIAALQGK